MYKGQLKSSTLFTLSWPRLLIIVGVKILASSDGQHSQASLHEYLRLTADHQTLTLLSLRNYIIITASHLHQQLVITVSCNQCCFEGMEPNHEVSDLYEDNEANDPIDEISVVSSILIASIRQM